ncbi:hypothetical protein [Amycolatopsis sp. NPDC098790]
MISDFGIAHELDSTHITGTGLIAGTTVRDGVSAPLADGARRERKSRST